MKILLTGASGFIGNFFLTDIKEKYSIWAISRSSNLKNIESLNYIPIDFSSKFNFESLPKDIDTIIHLAQSKNYRLFPEKSLDIFSVNCSSTIQLLEYGREIGISKFIFASTGSVYSPNINPYKENDKIEPNNFYATTKYISEQLIKSYSDYFDTTILRFFFVYGPNQKGMLIPNIINSIKEGKTIYLNSKEGMKFTPTYIDDAVAAIEKSISLRGNNTLNISGNETISIRKISETIGKLLGREPIFEYKEGKEVNYIADNSLMKSLLQINETTSVEDGLRKTIGY
jgi:nucleoside-diphosphate-sugar epimerase